MILLVSWLDIPFSNTDGDYQVLEFFAGVGRVAALSKKYGYKSCALDISYGQDRFQSANKRSPLDINSDAGLVPLVCTRKTNCLIIFEGLNLFSIFIVTEYTHIITGQIHPAAAACVAARWTRNIRDILFGTKWISCFIMNLGDNLKRNTCSDQMDITIYFEHFAGNLKRNTCWDQMDIMIHYESLLFGPSCL